MAILRRLSFVCMFVGVFLVARSAVALPPLSVTKTEVSPDGTTLFITGASMCGVSTS